MAGIKDYSTTQANNIDLNGISTAEGMLPSNLNNAIRALMKNTREWYNDSQWVEYGDGDAAFTAAYASGTSFTIAGVNVTAIYHTGRRIKLTASTPGTIYGTISSSTFFTNTTINVTWDSGSLSSEAITNIYIAALSKTNTSIPGEVIGTTQLVDGSVTTAKLADDAVTVAKMAVNSVDSDQYVDGSIDTAHIASAQITADKIGTDAVTTAKINADAITSAKIGDDQIDSEHYVDGSIDTAHIADLQITVAKMAVNSIDSDQYVDGSIDTAHIADSQITSVKIANDSIVDADINSSAAIDATKIADGTVTSSEFQYINTLSSNAQTQIDAKAATTYVDNAVAGLRTRIIAECASTANVVISSALEAGDVIDGVTLVSGDRVLLKNQSTATENGLYLAVSSGAASRDPEHDTIAELSGGMVVVNQGSVNDDKIFLCTTNTDATLGSTSITYTTITPQNVGTVTSITAGTGLSGGAITSSGTIAIDTGTTVDKTTAQTLTNKTLTTPIITSISNTGTVTIPSGADTLVARTSTDTLTNKTLTSPKINEDVVVTSTATELNKLDALSRGSIIYGNASAATTVLTKGTATQVLTSDGTDISWSDSASGGIDWQTIITASTLTAVAGNAYWIDTTSNTCTITLPSSASNGDQIILADYARTWGTNKIIIDSNGLNYQGEDDTFNVEYRINGQTINIVYSGATNGWIPLDDDDVAEAPVEPPTQKAIFGYGSNGGFLSMTNLVSNLGVVATDTTGVGTARHALAAAGYGGDKAIFGYGSTGSNVSMTNLVSNLGVVATDTTGVGTARYALAAAGYGGDKAIFGYGSTGGSLSMTNLVSNLGVVATDTTGVGTARQYLAAAGYSTTA